MPINDFVEDHRKLPTKKIRSLVVRKGLHKLAKQGIIDIFYVDENRFSLSKRK